MALDRTSRASFTPGPSCCRGGSCSTASKLRRTSSSSSFSLPWPRSPCWCVTSSEGGRSLSGGQKQAIALARALIRKPQVLFLDEPTAHFDTRSETEFIDRLRRLAQGEMTILVSTHRMSLLSLIDRLLVFEQGRLILDGPRDLVIARLQSSAGPTLQPQIRPEVDAAI